MILAPWALSKALWKHTSSSRPTRHATDSHPSAPPIHSFVTYGANQRNICDWLIDDDDDDDGADADKRDEL